MTVLKIAGAILFYIGGYIAMHVLVYREIANGLEFNRAIKAITAITLILLGSLIITSRILDSFMETKIMFLVGATWFGIIFTALPVFVIEFIFRLIFKKKRKLLAISAILLTAVLSVSALFISRFSLHVKEVKLEYEGLPEQLNGYTIIQISDIHLGALTTVDWFAEITEKINLAKPDLIVITGDLIDQDICDYKEYCNLLRSLNAKDGVFIIPGNHEYYAGFTYFERVVNEGNLTLLVNENKKINRFLYIAGIDDPAGRQMKNTKPDVEKAIKGIGTDKFLIFLTHRPEYFDDVYNKGADLVLAGHTHAGQIFPNDLIIRFYMKYHFGLYKKNGSYLYTT
ncbi:MAG TPA: metallophosphoesterase, partial [Firmicutes bacterium]|nr:metallophosphoesterase [Bacillota bacterium]